MWSLARLASSSFSSFKWGEGHPSLPFLSKARSFLPSLRFVTWPSFFFFSSYWGHWWKLLEHPQFLGESCQYCGQTDASAWQRVPRRALPLDVTPILPVDGKNSLWWPVLPILYKPPLRNSCQTAPVVPRDRHYPLVITSCLKTLWDYKELHPRPTPV